MTQTVPATAVLGPGATGLTIGLRVLNLDGTTYAAFSTTGVAETSVAGTYRKAAGVVCPDAGAYIVWGTAGTDYAEATVEPVTALSDIQARIPAALVGGRIDAALSAAGLATDAGAEIATAVRSELAVELAHIDAIQAVTDALDVSAVTQVAASSAGHLTITVGLTFDEAVTGLTIPADWKTALWTLKNNARDADTAALVQLRETNPAAGGDGLQRLNGAALVAPITAADGALTVTQATGRIDVYLTDEMTAMLGAATAIGWDVKFIDADGDSSGQRGTADVVLTETKSTV